MNSKQLKIRNDQVRLRFQCLVVQTENLQVVVWFLLLLPVLLQFGPLFYLLKATLIPNVYFYLFKKKKNKRQVSSPSGGRKH